MYTAGRPARSARSTPRRTRRLPELPSFYAKRNCWYGASFPGPREIEGRARRRPRQDPLGQRLPALRGQLSRTRARTCATPSPRCPSREVRMMLGENAAQLYGFDLDALRPARERGRHHARARRDASSTRFPPTRSAWRSSARASSAQRRSVSRGSATALDGRGRRSALAQGSGDARAAARGGQAACSRRTASSTRAISDISKRARLSHGSFYHYFDSKEQIFREVAEAQERMLTAPPAVEQPKRRRRAVPPRADSPGEPPLSRAVPRRGADHGRDRAGLPLRRARHRGARRDPEALRRPRRAQHPAAAEGRAWPIGASTR